MTELDLNTRFSAPPQVLSRLVGNETVLLNLETGIYFGVDGVGQRVWELADGQRSLDQIVDVVVAEFDVDRSQAEADICAFAKTLVERGLLVEQLAKHA